MRGDRIYCVKAIDGMAVNTIAAQYDLPADRVLPLKPITMREYSHQEREHKLQRRRELYKEKKEEERKKRSAERLSKIGSGDRSQRIRTYNFPENRITDHRINLTLYKLDQILSGNLDQLIDGLLEYERQELRSTFGTIE